MVDTVNIQAKLPQDKINKAVQSLKLLARKRKAALCELQTVIGLLNFMCRVIMPGRAFLRRLNILTHGLAKPHHHVRLITEARKDIDAWLSILSHYNGVSILRIRFICSPMLLLKGALLGFSTTVG